MSTEFSKTFSGQQPRQVAEQRVNRLFENHHCSRHCNHLTWPLAREIFTETPQKSKIRFCKQQTMKTVRMNAVGIIILGISDFRSLA